MMAAKDLEGRVAIVTGGSRGIGRAVALSLVESGASVVVSSRDAGRVGAAARELESLGGAALGVAGDVAKQEDVERVVAQARERFGRIDILVNNAGVTRDDLLLRMSEEQWDIVMAVNLKGTFLCSQAASVPMMAQKFGRIVNTSSIGALGNIGQANYSASKAGVIGLTKTLALEWARFNIAVNCVAPGATKTRMTAGIPDNLMAGLLEKIPFRRLAEPEEIAGAHLFFASDDAGYITGQVLFVDGGISVGV